MIHNFIITPQAQRDFDHAFLFYEEQLAGLGNRGVRKAQQENRRLGIPNVYFKDGVIYYQLPNGEITTKQPKEFPQN